MKKCPYCSGDIQDAAIKCKHCGQLLVRDSAQVVRQPGVISLSKEFYYRTRCGGEILSIEARDLQSAAELVRQNMLKRYNKTVDPEFVNAGNLEIFYIQNGWEVDQRGPRTLFLKKKKAKFEWGSFIGFSLILSPIAGIIYSLFTAGRTRVSTTSWEIGTECRLLRQEEKTIGELGFARGLILICLLGFGLWGIYTWINPNVLKNIAITSLYKQEWIPLEEIKKHYRVPVTDIDPGEWKDYPVVYFDGAGVVSSGIFFGDLFAMVSNAIDSQGEKMLRDVQIQSVEAKPVAVPTSYDIPGFLQVNQWINLTIRLRENDVFGPALVNPGYFKDADFSFGCSDSRKSCYVTDINSVYQIYKKAKFLTTGISIEKTHDQRNTQFIQCPYCRAKIPASSRFCPSCKHNIG